ncbi:WhiB family transcriptional regulator [Streptomyces virginiae]|uniref:WhiB family transcriptional regulator n=1 Tax=Streptomyces virginiae TaxID=1961 RepID=A0ABZ1TE24_STRVG|nr:WhiB family transcriptional regulator [Streptomyces virginiae]
MNRLHDLRAPDTAARAYHWRDDAACFGRAALFLPRKDYGPEYLASTLKAKRICENCPVRKACLDEAMATERADGEGGRAGVRGGLTPRERTARYSRQRRGIPEPATLLDQYLRRTEALDDGHVRWTVSTNNIAYLGRQYTPMQLAWALATRREPEGLLRTGCGLAGCVAAEHLTDAAMRRARSHTKRYAA